MAASDLVLRGLDKPLLVGRNWLRDVTTQLQWRTSGSWASGADSTSGATLRVWDDFDHLRSGSGSSTTPWYLLIDLGDTNPGVVDFVAMLNVSGLAGVTVTVEIADDNTYTTRAETIATATPTANPGRLIFPSLYHEGSTPLRYSGVRWMRIGFAKGGGCRPYLGEVVIGRSRQMLASPLSPFDTKNLVSASSSFEAFSGIRSRYVYSKNRRKISASLVTNTTTLATELEDFWIDDIDGGTLPFLYLDKPTTSPQAAYWVSMDDPELVFPTTGYVMRNFELAATEHGSLWVGNK